MPGVYKRMMGDGKRRTKLELLQRWWVSLALFLSLAGGVWLTAVDSANRGHSDRGWLARVLGVERLDWSGEFLPQPEVYAVLPAASSKSGWAHTSDRLQLIDPESESWGELSALMEREQERLATVRFEGWIGRDGLWVATREDRNAVISVEPIVPGSFSPDQIAEARRIAAAQFEQRGIPEVAALARAAAATDLHEKRVLWRGVGANVGMVVLAAAWVVSLGFVPRMLAARRARLGASRLARGRCPRCSYELLGLEAAQCPECGAELPARREAAGRVEAHEVAQTATGAAASP